MRVSADVKFTIAIALLLSACGNPTVIETGPKVELGPAELSLTINTDGEVVVSGSVAPTLIGIENLGGIEWEIGFETTLNQAQSKINHLIILYEDGDGNIIQYEYNVHQPFDIRFSEQDWVSRMKREDNGSIVVFVQQHVALQPNSDTTEPGNSVASAPEQFIRDYYATVSADDYATAWNLLTDNFKNAHNKTGFDPYKQYWSTVDHVEVNTVSVTAQDSRSANLYVELSYYFTNGDVDTNDLMSYTLRYSSATGTWMLEDAALISGTR